MSSNSKNAIKKKYIGIYKFITLLNGATDTGPGCGIDLRLFSINLLRQFFFKSHNYEQNTLTISKIIDPDCILHVTLGFQF